MSRKGKEKLIEKVNRVKKEMEEVKLRTEKKLSQFSFVVFCCERQFFFHQRIFKHV